MDGAHRFFFFFFILAEGRARRGKGRMWEGMGHGFTWICVDVGLGPGNKKI